jgi:hypothetical protein
MREREDTHKAVDMFLRPKKLLQEGLVIANISNRVAEVLLRKLYQSKFT